MEVTGEKNKDGSANASPAAARPPEPEQPAKVVEKTNWRVVIEPDTKYTRFWTESDFRDACQQILDQAKRHVDGVGSAEILFDTETTCFFCGYEWEEDANGRPECCGKAQSLFDAARAGG